MIGPVFLATPIGMSEESALVHAQYLEDGWGVTVCQAKAVFEDKFQEVGGWSGFASFVGVGVNYHTDCRKSPGSREGSFHSFIGRR